ncbi:phage baseplate assembly protein V [Salmonella enterica]|uniref:phage baseplate assembly protein V n=1 Tax=Salmonella enterica TaxID=28901 RepID=UPI001F068D0F|nr:phage baseplate assembly protein V [Salmonella enterica]
MNDLETLIRQLIRVGVVSDIDEKGVTARVTFDDQDNVTSASLQVIVKNTDENADYWMPDVGEQVLCLFFPVGPQQGFILGSFTMKRIPSCKHRKQARYQIQERNPY